MTRAMQKFQTIQLENQISIERHLELYNYSSSEEEFDGDEEEAQKVIDNIFSSYEGKGIDREKILSHLINSFQSGQVVCLICISTIKKIDPIWNCGTCYSSQHLPCILQWIHDSLTPKRQQGLALLWACPKCRTEYKEASIPQQYKCFCEKITDPSPQEWSIPHSCGEICNKQLEPKCGHKCVLLCHPGPCPPCAKQVTVKCYCEKQPAQPKRCNARSWSCNETCGKKYPNCCHACKEICHSGMCPPCSELLPSECNCKANEEIRICSCSIWKCSTPCLRAFSCGVHICEEDCHGISDCGQCPYENNRTCPCGKKRYSISCQQQQASTCGDTCGKLLNCGYHRCNMKCHHDSCGQCLEIVEKYCNCRSYKKELACAKEFHCAKKCPQLRLCGRHLCNKKCCNCLVERSFNGCEKICDNTLNCRKHKCLALCHRGPCYPCTRVDTIQCRCGYRQITVPCGTKKRIKPPTCNKLCKIPPACHHTKRESHRCHQGACPACKKICELTYKRCGHTCTATCHTKVWTKVVPKDGKNQPSGPWEIKPKDTFHLKTLPCPPCQVFVPVTCLGGHETSMLPCHTSKPTSCQRVCGQLLKCGNHNCELICHRINNFNCMDCEEPCTLGRAKECIHECPKACHPAPCPPCEKFLRIPCHCGINTLYRNCHEFTGASKEKRIELLKCGNQCPKNYPCGHRCIEDCHPGPCGDGEECKRRVKITCKCNQIKKQFICSEARKTNPVIECNDICHSIREEGQRIREKELAKKLEEEMIRNQEEVAKFERKFKPRRRGKDRNNVEIVRKNHYFGKLMILFGFVVLTSFTGFVYYNYINDR